MSIITETNGFEILIKRVVFAVNYMKVRKCSLLLLTGTPSRVYRQGLFTGEGPGG